jgi:catechol 2,3-dioxygenase-like lactoylglutathione lyase family enzyme
MRPLTRRCLAVALALSVLGAAAPAAAQLAAAKDGPVVYGHHHLYVTTVDDHKRFWIGALGGTEGKFGSTDIIKVRNALIFLAARKPTAGSKGSTVDHLAFSVPNLRATVDRLKAAGFRMVSAAEAPANVAVKDDIGLVPGTGPVTGIAYVMAPDDVKVELLEMKAQAEPAKLHHVHFYGTQQAEMRDWYVKVFGATAAPPGNPNFITANLPGVGLNFSVSAAPTVPTTGRVLDHIGFEVKNLAEFLKKLEAQGIKPSVTLRRVDALAINIAFVVDPWGTNIELTEGLDKIQ